MLEVPYRYKPGDRVRVAQQPAERHCRTPSYLRGKPGVVMSVTGAYRNPSLLAFHKPGLPVIPLYRVRFRQDDVWEDATGSPDSVAADIYEHWLLPADGSDTGETSHG